MTASRAIRDVPVGAVTNDGRIVANAYSPRGGGTCVVTFDDGSVREMRAAARVEVLAIVLTCPRCKREVHPWPLQRGAKCSPKDWAHCIRNDDPSEWKR